MPVRDSAGFCSALVRSYPDVVPVGSVGICVQSAEFHLRQVMNDKGRGHASVQTTERYIGRKQKLQDAVNDRLGISAANSAAQKV
jgi:hypothetical protein